MNFTCINNSEIQKVLIQENWLSMISNTKNLSEKIKAMFNQGGMIKSSTCTILTTNLICLMDEKNTQTFLRLKTELITDIKVNTENQSYIFEFKKISLQSGYYSNDVFFIERLSTNYLGISNHYKACNFDDYLSINKLSALQLINLRSIKESLEWIVAQNIQSHNHQNTSHLRVA